MHLLPQLSHRGAVAGRRVIHFLGGH